MAFLIPNFNRFLTSFRPSTIIRASLLAAFGPQVIPEMLVSVPSVSTLRTSSKMLLLSFEPSFTMLRSKSFARSMTVSRLTLCIFSILATLIVALHGPIRSIVSSAAPTTAVDTWSRLLGSRISPDTLPLLDLRSTSTWPIRPVRCNFRNCSSSPSSPSV